MKHMFAGLPCSPTKRRSGALVTALCAVCAAGSAHAQDTDQADSRAEVREPITLTQTRQIDFGQILPGPNGINRISMSPEATPTCQEINGALHFGVCQSGEFEGTASAGAQMTVQLSARSVRLDGPTRETLLLRFITVGSGPGIDVGRRNGRRYPATVTDPNGEFTFYVAGDIWPTADQAPGVYTGTFGVQVDYQ